MAGQLTIRINAEDGIAVVSRPTFARRLALAIAAVAGNQILAFPAAAQQEVSAACKICGEQCGTPIFYPESGGCPNPIFYPESMIAIGAALIVGVFIGFRVGRNKNAGRPTG